ncbi:hypothetical protein BAUCODRAFT_547777 [Baudoinia panamericana UAMH 10762]|uniref:Uncharacterized protein n=1 Tax=Baudoinia panamericana (strain UAMH 10762) TaxID=717646 RepID=M2N6M2_BAUPA|nr:uncharacterized protein BAUCODRAFT_547777 [Baudoinia panamericana UAMH 10762]EMC94425.1 hypothetical protein BAUCODRAFT_547777 [Baudoinia panamericana UAMH 10762]
MAGRRRHLRRRKSWEYGDGAINIRVGSRRSPRRFYEVTVSGARDAPRFARCIDDQVRAFPRDPIVISINGYQPWLQKVLGTCIEDYWSEIADLAREVQFAETMQFPEKASKRGDDVPWTFILDYMNVPHVYYWSVDMEPPESDDYGLPAIDTYRFRVGAWECGKGACRFDREVPVAIIFTKPTPVCEHVVTELMFPFLYRDNDFDQPREDEEGICWLFSRLYWLLTDWQNIISAVSIRLEEAETNSHERHLPVKTRTRMLHREVDRLYELKEYMRFHNRSFKKLQKLKDDVPKQEQKDPLWNDMDDAVEDLEQYDSTMDSLKERFNNLIELEFNIQNALQSDQGQFLTTIATLFLPLSYLASIWGITTITWPPIWYLYAAIPVLIVSIIFTASFPFIVRRIQKVFYPIEEYRIQLQPRNFTMLGEELPANVDIPGGGGRQGRVKHKAPRMAAHESARSRSKSRIRPEKVDDE